MKVGEVAALFRVDAKTVERWVRQGQLPAIRTPGNQLRFERAEIERRLPKAAS